MDANRKIFIGGLSYGTDDAKLRTYFAVYGAVQDAVVMKDPVSRRSRGFGFITYVDPSSVDSALAAEPHVIDSRKVEAKRSVPKMENAAGGSGSGTGGSSKQTNADAGISSSSTSRSAGAKRSGARAVTTAAVPPPSSSASTGAKLLSPQTAVTSSSSKASATTGSGLGSSDNPVYNKIFVGGLHYETRETDIRNYFERFGTIVSAEVMFNRETHKSRGFGFVVYESDGAARDVCAVAEHIVNGKKVEVKLAIPRSAIPPGATSVAIAGMNVAGGAVASQDTGALKKEVSANTTEKNAEDLNSSAPSSAPAVVSSPEKKKELFSVVASQIGQPKTQSKRPKVSEKPPLGAPKAVAVDSKVEQVEVVVEKARPVSFAAALKKHSDSVGSAATSNHSNSGVPGDKSNLGTGLSTETDDGGGLYVNNEYGVAASGGQTAPSVGVYLSALKSSLGPADKTRVNARESKNDASSTPSDTDKLSLFEKSSPLLEEEDQRLRSQSNLSVASLASSVLNASSQSSNAAHGSGATSPWTEPASLSLGAPVKGKDRSPSLGDIAWLQNPPSGLPLENAPKVTSELLGSRTDRAGSITGDGSVVSDGGDSTGSIGNSAGVADQHWQHQVYQPQYQQQHYSMQNSYGSLPPGWQQQQQQDMHSYGGQFDHLQYQYQQRYPRQPSLTQDPYLGGNSHSQKIAPSHATDVWNMNYYQATQQQPPQHHSSGGESHYNRQQYLPPQQGVWGENNATNGYAPAYAGMYTSPMKEQCNGGSQVTAEGTESPGGDRSGEADEFLAMNSLRLIDSPTETPVVKASSAPGFSSGSAWNSAK